ncbi:hypothetical protein Btru_067947 [Bulinus truncatus]|nr:hypothetical protein Btru_067947 [Bulinus truncatus]
MSESYNGDSYYPLHITKREISRNLGFSHQEKMAILNSHNLYRSREGASNMLRMSWNKDLEKLAQDYAEECIFQHSPGEYRTNVAGFIYIGENLFRSTDTFPVTLPVILWWNETHAYNYYTDQCVDDEVCGHYTQIVWENSYALGCGVKYCPKHGYNYVCHYGPG